MPDGWTLVRPAQQQSASPDGWTLVKPVVQAAAPAPATPNASAGYYGGALEVGKGALKGLGHTAATLGGLLHKIPGVSETINEAWEGIYGDGDPMRRPLQTAERQGVSDAAFKAADQVTVPTNTPQRAGAALEQVAEFLVPAGAGEKTAATIAAKVAPYFSNAPRLIQAGVKVAPRMVNEAVKSAAVTGAQGGDPLTAAAFGAAGPVVGAGVSGAGTYLGAKAEALVLSAVKPTVASLRRIAGASATGLEAQATKLARFILDTGATTPEKARAIMTKAEQELQRVLSVKNAPTDAAQRSARYLAALEKSAAKQGLPAADVATIRNAAAEVLEGSMGTDVVTMVPGPHPTLVGPNGQPITVLQPQTTRVHRTDIMADEALERARKTSQWETRKAYGEQKGAQMESAKAVERAQRDAVKIAVPETKPILQQQSQALTAINALDRMAQRAGNRDALSLAGAVVGAGEVAAGQAPKLAFAAQWLRNNQMKAGVWANKLSKAIENEDVQEVGAIMQKLGAGSVAQTTR
jgi:hypothetical protein